MGINHRRGNIAMTQQFLDGSDVVAILPRKKLAVFCAASLTRLGADVSSNSASAAA
jgi:hypothetical protein